MAFCDPCHPVQLGEARLLPASRQPEPEGSGQGQAEVRPSGAGSRRHVQIGQWATTGTARAQYRDWNFAARPVNHIIKRKSPVSSFAVFTLSRS